MRWSKNFLFYLHLHVSKLKIITQQLKLDHDTKITETNTRKNLQETHIFADKSIRGDRECWKKSFFKNLAFNECDEKKLKWTSGKRESFVQLENVVEDSSFQLTLKRSARPIEFQQKKSLLQFRWLLLHRRGLVQQPISAFRLSQTFFFFVPKVHTKKVHKTLNVKKKFL